MYSEEMTLARMVERRRDLHRYPETGWAEYRTTSKIAEALAAAGMDIRFTGDLIDPTSVMGRGTDNEAQEERAIRQGASPEIIKKMRGLTGLVAEVDTGCPGPLTALRFDIDSVDTTETEDPEHLPVICGFRSVNNGSMHACAHDGHAAVGMTLAEVISAERDSLRGKIRFIFQPAEEGARGGYAFLKAGSVDDADYFLTLHLGLGNPTGTVFGGTDGFLYSTKIDADYKGVGAHAGAEPQKGRNALLAAASAALPTSALRACSPNCRASSVSTARSLSRGLGRTAPATPSSGPAASGSARARARATRPACGTSASRARAARSAPPD